MPQETIFQEFPESSTQNRWPALLEDSPTPCAVSVFGCRRKKKTSCVRSWTC